MSQVICQDGFCTDAWSDIFIPNMAQYQDGAALLLHPHEELAQLGPFLPQLKLIVIAFDTSADGRGFSMARALRIAGFTGHLRARGHLLVDQFRAAIRAGFDDIEISDAQTARNPEEQWKTVSFTQGYQPRIFQKVPA